MCIPTKNLESFISFIFLKDSSIFHEKLKHSMPFQGSNLFYRTLFKRSL